MEMTKGHADHEDKIAGRIGPGGGREGASRAGAAMMRLGLFGGTFDPIHDAHLAVAREAADAFSLDQVWFIPNSIPPHKATGAHASWADRFAMAELACAADPRFRASRLEEANRKSYTIHTLETVRARLAEDDRIYFLIGADAFADIDVWYRKRMYSP